MASQRARARPDLRGLAGDGVHQERAAGGADGAGAGRAVPRRGRHDRRRRLELLQLRQHRDLPPRLPVRLPGPPAPRLRALPGPLQPPLLVAPERRRGRLLRARTPRRWPQRWLRRRVEPAEHDQVRIRLPRPASHLRSAPVLTKLHRCFSSEGKAEDAMVARLEKHTGPVSRAGLAS